MFSFGLVLCLGSLLLLGGPSFIVGLACFLVGALLYATMPVSAVFRRFSDGETDVILADVVLTFAGLWSRFLWLFNPKDEMVTAQRRYTPNALLAQFGGIVVVATCSWAQYDFLPWITGVILLLIGSMLILDLASGNQPGPAYGFVVATLVLGPLPSQLPDLATSLWTIGKFALIATLFSLLVGVLRIGLAQLGMTEGRLTRPSELDWFAGELWFPPPLVGRFVSSGVYEVNEVRPTNELWFDVVERLLGVARAAIMDVTNINTESATYVELLACLKAKVPILAICHVDDRARIVDLLRVRLPDTLILPEDIAQLRDRERGGVVQLASYAGAAGDACHLYDHIGYFYGEIVDLPSEPIQIK